MDRARDLSPARTGGDEIGRLKTLLFRPESQQITALEQQVGALSQRVGTPDRMEKATAEILVEALRRAEVNQHRELADAMAPMVVAAIRNEIRNSRDMMVEALYPITGRLVSAGIALAVADLAASINAKMDALLSIDVLKLRFQAWRTGVPFSQLALALSQHGRLVRLLYLERGSGQLLGQWQADHGEDARADLISGMIAALTDFARNALGEGGGELRTLDMGGAKIYLRTSAQMIVAAEYSGTPSTAQQRSLDAAFLDLLDSQAEPETALQTLATRLERAEVPGPLKKRRFSPLAVAAVLLAAGLAVWGTIAFQRWRVESRVERALAGVIAARPALTDYPVRLATHHRRSVVELHGLVPSQADQAALDEAVKAAAAPYAMQSTLAVITTQPRLDAMAAANLALEQRLAGLNGETRALESQLASETAATRTQMAERTQGEIASLSARLAQYYTDLNSTRAKLSGETGEGVLALHGEIEAGLARLSNESNAIRAQSDAQLQAELAGLSATVGKLGADLADARALSAQQADATQASIATVQATVAASIAAVQEGLSQKAEAGFADVAAKLGQLQADLEAGKAQLAEQASRQAAAAVSRIDAMQARLDTPRAKLDEALRGFAVFFVGTDTLEDEPGTRAALANIAVLANAAGGIRVVGYSDETGTLAVNRRISRRRAEIVAQLLRDAGADPQRIVISSRTVTAPLADRADPTRQRSRRVTLEPVYAKELGP